jgi:hypothetical protein
LNAGKNREDAEQGVEIDRRVLCDASVTRGQLAIADTTDQGKHRPTKVASLSQGELVRAELRDAQIVWLAQDRMTLTGYEQIDNEVGQLVEYRQSWLVMLETGRAIPELGKCKVSPNA